MAIDPQLTAFFPHTVTIAPFSSRGNYGDESYGSTRTAKAYVEPSRLLKQGDTVNEETRPMTAYISDTSITIRDKITLPDGTTPEISNIEIHNVVVGLEHTLVTFK